MRYGYRLFLNAPWAIHGLRKVGMLLDYTFLAGSVARSKSRV